MMIDGTQNDRSAGRTLALGLGVLAFLLPTQAAASATSPALDASTRVTSNNQAPTFNDYVVCLGDGIWTDFRDPDGSDNKLEVTLYAYRPNAPIQKRRMQVVESGHHGVFWYLDRREAGVAGAQHYLLQATDPWGAKSSFVLLNAGCQILDD